MTVPDPTQTGPVDTAPEAAEPEPEYTIPTDPPGPHDSSDPSDTSDTSDPTPGSEPEPVYTIPSGPADGSPDYRMALVASVTVDLPNQHPSVCLREMETPRRQLTFSVGLPDGIALSHAMRRIPTPRPLTHELMSGVLQRFDIDLVAVRIVGRVGAVHFAELDLRGTGGRSVHSCRPTDALILALHQPVQVPILIDARLLASGGDVPPPNSA